MGAVCVYSSGTSSRLWATNPTVKTQNCDSAELPHAAAVYSHTPSLTLSNLLFPIPTILSF